MNRGRHQPAATARERAKSSPPADRTAPRRLRQHPGAMRSVYRWQGESQAGRGASAADQDARATLRRARGRDQAPTIRMNFPRSSRSQWLAVCRAYLEWVESETRHRDRLSLESCKSLFRSLPCCCCCRCTQRASRRNCSTRRGVPVFGAAAGHRSARGALPDRARAITCTATNSNSRPSPPASASGRGAVAARRGPQRRVFRRGARPTAAKCASGCRSSAGGAGAAVKLNGSLAGLRRRRRLLHAAGADGRRSRSPRLAGRRARRRNAVPRACAAGAPRRARDRRRADCAACSKADSGADRAAFSASACCSRSRLACCR